MRGVYWVQIVGTCQFSGSSPRARGLLLIVPFHVPSRGIIPACAGFTTALVGCCMSDGDHPRVRGVYVVVDGVEVSRLGSSPRARGLRFVCRSGDAHGWDHPRVRGVYA